MAVPADLLYSDAYEVLLPRPMSAEEFLRRVIESVPAWMEHLLSARDRIVGPLGFSRQVRNYGEPVTLRAGAQYGPIRVLGIAPDLVRTGKTEEHLSYETTFGVVRRDGHSYGECRSTVVATDRLGKLYFTAIKPFHRMILPRLIRRPFSPIPDKDQS